MVVLGYLPRIKRGLGLTFGAHFLHDFVQKCSLFNTLSTDKVSMPYLFTSVIYQTQYVIKFLFRQLMTALTLRFIFDRLLKQWPTRKKRQEERNTKI